MQKIIKKVKPVDTDIQLIYQCPDCTTQHWVLLREAQNKRFAIHCDCGEYFRPKTIDSIKIKYVTTKKNLNKTNDKIIEQCVCVLKQYGFDTKEAKHFIEKAYLQLEEKNRSISNIIKLSLILFGENNG